MSDLSTKIARLSKWMIDVEAYGTETIAAICSVWAANKLSMSPNIFSNEPAKFFLASSLMAHEMDWAIVAAGAALLIVIGLALTTVRMLPSLSIFCRCVGLGISGFFWSVMGWSYLLGNPDSLAAIPLIMIGARTLWTLARFPFVPRTVNHL